MTFIMNFIIIPLMCIVGIVPSIYLLFSIPAVIGFKIYRKARFGITIWN